MLTIALSPALQAFNPSYNSGVQEFVITVPSDDITITPEGISVEYQGQQFPVQALFKSGQQWTVQFRVGLFSYPEGHMRVCPYCGGCGNPICRFYCDSTCT